MMGFSLFNRPVRRAVLVLLGVAGSSTLTAAQIAQDLSRAAELVVAIDAKVGERAQVGAGVVIARQRDALIVVTANHVVRQGTLPAQTVTVRLKSAPTHPLSAVLLPNFDQGDDLAVLRVEHLVAQKIDPCALPVPRFEVGLTTRRGQGVFALGNPGGVAWRIPSAPEPVAEVDVRQIMFQSSLLEAGHSGGGLYNAFGDLIGIIRADQPPNGVAVPLARVLSTLRQLGIPIEGAGSAQKAAPQVGNACSREEPSVLQVSVDARATVLPTKADAWDLGFERPRVVEVFEAVREGRLDDVKRLVDAEALDTDGYHPPFPLHWAVAFGQVEVVKQLLLMGAKKNAWVYFGGPPGTSLRQGTALHWAAALNRVAVIQVLIRAGAELEEGEGLDQGPGTPLGVAAAFGHLEAARILIAAGAKVESMRHGAETSPLGQAVANGRIDMLELLRNSHARLSSTDWPEGASVLLWMAVANHQYGVMRYLIRNGVPLRDSKVSDRYDPMREAVLDKQADALQILLKAGADPNGDPFDPYVQLAIENNNLDILKALLKAGANPNMRNRDGESMLHIAQKNEKNTAVELLRAMGAR